MGSPIKDRLAAGFTLIGIATMTIGVLSGYAATAGYSHWRQFISELAFRNNPDAWRMNVGLEVGGFVAAAGLAYWAMILRGAWRWAAGLAAFALVGVAFVGVYPIYEGMKHVAAALAAVALGIAASIVLCVAAGKARHRFARVALGLAIAQGVAIVGGSVAAWLMVKVGVLEPQFLFAGRAGLIDNPLWSGSQINPIAIAEWLYFSAAALLLLGCVAMTLVGSRDQFAPAGESQSNDRRAGSVDGDVVESQIADD